MKKEDEIRGFIQDNEEATIVEYSNRIYENLRDLNKNEEKHSLWLVIATLVYMMVDNLSIVSLNIGPITITDISVMLKILPLVFIYILFNLRIISGHKRDVLLSLKILSEKKLKIGDIKEATVFTNNSFLSRVYFPYSFSHSVSKIISKDITVVEAVFGFLFLAPLLLIALVPYAIIIFMLVDLYQNHTEDYIGIFCFWISIWMMAVLFFYIFKSAILQNKDNHKLK